MLRVVVIAALALLLGSCGQATRPVTVHAADSPPSLLSDWGIVFADGRTFTLNDAVTPYDLNTPLFTDYAQKLRTIYLPPGTSAEYEDTEAFNFPVGTVISKTFFYPRGDSPGLVRASAAASRRGPCPPRPRTGGSGRTGP